MRIPSGAVDRVVFFVAVDSTDLKTRETGLTTFTVYYSLDDAGSATAMTTPTVAEIDATNMPGVYSLLLDESGMTTLTAGHDTEELALHITQASMAPVTRVVEIYRPETTQGNTLGVASDGDVSGNVDGSVASVTGAVGSVTGNVGGNVVGSVASVTGNVDGSVASVTGAVGSVTGAVGSVTGNVGGNVTGTIGSLAAQAKTDVNDQVLDVLNTDTFAEPGQAAPPTPTTLVAKIGYLYKFLRNRVTVTASTIKVYNDDATTVDHKSTHSDDATTYDRGEFAAGP